MIMQCGVSAAVCHRFPKHARTVLLRMAFFNHDMQKPTQLVGNLPNLVAMKRTMTRARREKFRLRFARCLHSQGAALRA